jgi:electron transfer flavoprotein alpha subunit
MILVVAEQRGGALNRASWEALTCAQQLGGEVVLLVAGQRIDAVVQELAAADVREVTVVDQPALADYTADGYTAALAEALSALTPGIVLFPHTYQVRDFVPKLAARAGRTAITDVVAVRQESDRVVCVRPMYQGKLMADVVASGGAPHIITVQAGAFRAADARRGSAAAPVRTLDITVDAGAIRQKPEPPFQEARQAVDLTQAERIVSVGRGIKEQANISVAQRLADALHAELAASRPICDAGWLPMDRQGGSSGQTVAPKLYVALGISGAIQHLVGMKGSQTIVAINKDADAPIFEVADYGIVGDLFEIVPALTTALKS